MKTSSAGNFTDYIEIIGKLSKVDRSLRKSERGENLFRLAKSAMCILIGVPRRTTTRIPTCLRFLGRVTPIRELSDRETTD